MHSDPCTGREGKVLRAYPDLAAATSAARRVRGDYGHDVVPYQCERCGRWHLCPTERHTPSHACHGCGKRAYESETAALRRARILLRERGVVLRVYACPNGQGWHLTKRDAFGCW